MLWSEYMRESINTTTKSKYTRVSRLVSSRDKSHEQAYRLESWQNLIKWVMNRDEMNANDQRNDNASETIWKYNSKPKNITKRKRLAVFSLDFR